MKLKINLWSVKWTGGPPPLLYVEHGSEQCKVPLDAANCVVEFPYVPSKSVDLMAFDPVLAHDDRGFLAGATVSPEQVMQQPDGMAAVGLFDVTSAMRGRIQLSMELVPITAPARATTSLLEPTTPLTPFADPTVQAAKAKPSGLGRLFSSALGRSKRSVNGGGPIVGSVGGPGALTTPTASSPAAATAAAAPAPAVQPASSISSPSMPASPKRFLAHRASGLSSAGGSGSAADESVAAAAAVAGSRGVVPGMLGLSALLPSHFSPLTSAHGKVAAATSPARSPGGAARRRGSGVFGAAPVGPPEQQAAVGGSADADAAAYAAYAAAAAAARGVERQQAALEAVAAQQRAVRESGAGIRAAGLMSMEAAQAAGGESEVAVLQRMLERQAAEGRAADTNLLRALAAQTAAEAERDAALESALRRGLRAASPRAGAMAPGAAGPFGAAAAPPAAPAAAARSARVGSRWAAPWDPLATAEDEEEEEEPLVSSRSRSTPRSGEFFSPVESFVSSAAGSTRVSGTADFISPRGFGESGAGAAPAAQAQGAAAAASATAGTLANAAAAAAAAFTKPVITSQRMFSRYAWVPSGGGSGGGSALEALSVRDHVVTAAPRDAPGGIAASRQRRFGYPSLEAAASGLGGDAVGMRAREAAAMVEAAGIKSRAAAAAAAAEAVVARNAAAEAKPSAAAAAGAPGELQHGGDNKVNGDSSKTKGRLARKASSRLASYLERVSPRMRAAAEILMDTSSSSSDAAAEATLTPPSPEPGAALQAGQQPSEAARAASPLGGAARAAAAAAQGPWSFPVPHPSRSPSPDVVAAAAAAAAAAAMTGAAPRRWVACKHGFASAVVVGAVDSYGSAVPQFPVMRAVTPDMLPSAPPAPPGLELAAGA